MNNIKHNELNSSNWLVEGHKEQLELGLGETTLLDEEYQKLLKYRQYLRDIPQDDNFPDVEILSLEDFKA